MKFALVNGEDAEATKGAKGFCKYCGSELVAHCGEVYAQHWAHKGKRNCDPWWENETQWHRSWKDKFPVEWQEVIQYAKDGEKHIADVKTESDWVLEIQHSYLKPEERRSRNAFYPKLVWVVDGLRRKTDITQFQKTLNDSDDLRVALKIRKVFLPEQPRLLKEWQHNQSLVFFDFHGTEEQNQAALWFLVPKFSEEMYLMPFSKQHFIALHNKNEFDDFVTNTVIPVQEVLIEQEQYREPAPAIQIRAPIMRRKKRRF